MSVLLFFYGGGMGDGNAMRALTAPAALGILFHVERMTSTRCRTKNERNKEGNEFIWEYFYITA